jgi:hypothetical protein
MAEPAQGEWTDVPDKPKGGDGWVDVPATDSFSLPPSGPRAAGDLATSLIRGMAKGTLAFAAGPGDLREGAATASNFIAEKTGADPAKGDDRKRLVSDMLKHAIPFLGGPTSDQLKEAVVKPTIGEFGKPQTTAGKYAESVGEFVPSVIGPGGAVRKGAEAIMGGLASEYAREKAEEYLGPIAGTIAGITAGAGAMSTARSLASKLTSDLVPSMAMLEEAADAAYKRARALPLQIDTGSIGRVTDSIIADLKAAGFRDYLADKTFKAIQELRTPAGTNATVTDIDGVRQLLGKAGAGDKVERAASKLARDRIDDYLANIPQNHVVAGSAADVSQIFRDARGNYAPLKRSERLMEAVEAAESRAGSTGSGANVENAIRQEVRKIREAIRKGKTGGYSKDEIEMMDRIIQGTPIGNAARQVGKFAPTGVVSAIPTIGAFLGGGKAAGLGVAGAGVAGKSVGEHLTRKGVSDLDRMIRSRSALNQSGVMPKPPTPEASFADLLARSGMATRAENE